jgi:ribokinase
MRFTNFPPADSPEERKKKISMTVFNLGSINIDLIYDMSRFPKPGETLAAVNHQRGLGGKGANQSVALSAAGVEVNHLGAINGSDKWLLDYLIDAGVNTTCIQCVDVPTGHAIVAVNSLGENQIILYPGANNAIDIERVERCLVNAKPGDWGLCQNETNGLNEFADAVLAAGLKLAYSAAPFNAELVLEMLPKVNLLVLNSLEAEELKEALGKDLVEIGIDHLVVTRGAEGAEYWGVAGHISRGSFPVKVFDTTGAGDCFLGFFLGAISKGESVDLALTQALAASAISVTSAGAAQSIPSLSQVDTFLLRYN